MFKNFILVYCGFWVLCVSISAADIEVGNIIDLFKNYGFLGQLLTDNHDKFSREEFSKNVFQNVPFKTIPDTNFENGAWKIQMYDNVKQLIHALFDGFNVEYVDDVISALILRFSGRNSREVVYEFLGIDGYPYRYYDTYYSYLLLKFVKCVKRYELADFQNEVQPLLNRTFEEAVENITREEETSLLRFVAKFGSHYLKSYSVGDIIYQVFLYPKLNYICSDESTFISPTTEDGLPDCVTPDIRNGNIKSFSQETENYYSSKYDNLFLIKNKNETNSVNDSCESRSRPITSFNLVSVDKIIKNEQKSKDVSEIINYHMRLRELSLGLESNFYDF